MKKTFEQSLVTWVCETIVYEHIKIVKKEKRFPKEVAIYPSLYNINPEEVLSYLTSTFPDITVTRSSYGDAVYIRMPESKSFI